MMKHSNIENDPFDSVPESDRADSHTDDAVRLSHSFRHSTWTTAALFAGLFLPLLWWGLGSWFADSWIQRVPSEILYPLYVVVPHFTLLVYPFITRRRHASNDSPRLTVKKMMIESLIAIPLILGCLALTGTIQTLVMYFLPETPVTPEPYQRMVRSPGTWYTYSFLVIMFTLGPVAEEIFFRGFVFNAFRRRMSLWLAILIQAVIFGMIHRFGWVNILATSMVGALLTLIYCWRKTLFTPTLVHAGNNGLIALAMFVSIQSFPDSPVLGVLPETSTTEYLIGSVLPGSPAEAAGIKPGDVVIQLGEYSIRNSRDLTNGMDWQEVGVPVDIVVRRGGETLHLKATPVARSTLNWQPVIDAP